MVKFTGSTSLSIVHVRQQAESMIQLTVQEHAGALAGLGIKHQHLVQIITAMSLDQEELDALVETRLQYKAGWHTMVRLLKETNLTASQIYALYEVRKNVNAQLGSDPSFGAIIRFSETFAEASIDEDVDTLSGIILESCDDYALITGCDHWTDTIITIICDLAEKLGTSTVEATLEGLKNQVSERVEHAFVRDPTYYKTTARDFDAWLALPGVNFVNLADPYNPAIAPRVSEIGDDIMSEPSKPQRARARNPEHHTNLNRCG